MMETSSRTIFMELENISGLMEESIMDHGLTIKWKGKVHSRGVMEEDMLECTRTIRSTVMELSNGQMVGSTLESGVKESNTARESTSKKARKDKVSGTWAKELNGLKTHLASNDSYSQMFNFIVE